MFGLAHIYYIHILFTHPILFEEPGAHSRDREPAYLKLKLLVKERDNKLLKYVIC